VAEELRCTRQEMREMAGKVRAAAEIMRRSAEAIELARKPRSDGE
jgi:hypothetical protein